MTNFEAKWLLSTALLVGCSSSGKTTIQEQADEQNTSTGTAVATTDDTDTTTDSTTDTQAYDSGQNTDTDTETETQPIEVINLLQNPSFENGDEHWNIWGGAQRQQEHAHDGTWALMASQQNGAEQRVEGLTPNTTYQLSGWGKSFGDNAISIGVKDYGGPQITADFNTENYTENSLTFSTGLSNTSATIFAYKHSGDSIGYTDNLQLFDTGTSPNTLVWSDDFDGSGALDATKWTFEEGFVRNEELQWYQAENAFRENGYLIIEGRQEQRANPNYIAGSTDWRTSREFIEYTSSSVTTKNLFTWQYGRMAVRAKVSNIQGTWPAIWTLGIECDWPSNGEVDIMENYGGDILGNFAWGSNQPWSPVWDVEKWSVSSLDSDWSNQFHIWELVWTEEKMTIYIDGTEINSVDLSNTINGNAACASQNPFKQPHYLLLNLALGGSAGGSVDNLPFPTRYIVDYVRVYQ